jgi:hypothetical protein
MTILLKTKKDSGQAGMTDDKKIICLFEVLTKKCFYTSCDTDLLSKKLSNIIKKTLSFES